MKQLHALKAVGIHHHHHCKDKGNFVCVCARTFSCVFYCHKTT